MHGKVPNCAESETFLCRVFPSFVGMMAKQTTKLTRVAVVRDDLVMVDSRCDSCLALGRADHCSQIHLLKHHPIAIIWYRTQSL